MAHLELTEQEAKRYKGIPVVYNGEVVRRPPDLVFAHPWYIRVVVTDPRFRTQGFLFEPRHVPNPLTGDLRWIIKLCDEFPGYTRNLPIRPFGAEKEIEVSVPRSHSDHPSDTVPDEGMKRLRRVVEVMLPEFKDREFVKSYCCWCTGMNLLSTARGLVRERLILLKMVDTDDAQWLFCEHPTCPGLYLATGDSGHSFTSLPIVGGQVADLLEGKVSLASPWACCHSRVSSY